MKTGASPQNATEKELCRITRDNSSIGNFTLMTDSHEVWISEQAAGSPPTQEITMRRETFNRLIEWYQKEQEFVRKEL